MKKTRIGGIAAIVIGITFSLGIFSINQNEKNVEGYHITLADPDLYENGVFSDVFDIEKGEYEFHFVPNGDSPEMLSISLEGSTFSFSEDFQLEGTPHETGISTYYTWDYLGEKVVKIDENQILRIEINPHNNFLGPVSIDLISMR